MKCGLDTFLASHIADMAREMELEEHKKKFNASMQLLHAIAHSALRVAKQIGEQTPEMRHYDFNDIMLIKIYPCRMQYDVELRPQHILHLAYEDVVKLLVPGVFNLRSLKTPS